MNDYRFGSFLHNIRKQRGLSQYQLGKLLGVSDKAVSKWENGYSKPQSSTLHKLSSILGITVDELLSCKHNPAKNELWKMAYQSLIARYGNDMPLEISNRYFSEYAELKETDMIIYFDLFRELSAMADLENQHMRIEGAVGSSFVAFIMGATEINPLPPHYYCSCCKTVEFDSSVYCGWDLPTKSCACGKLYLRDGHNLPFETLRFSIHKNTHFVISCSNDFYKSVKEKIGTLFGNIISVVPMQDLDKLRALEKECKTLSKNINFTDSHILEAFQNINTDGINEFEESCLKDLINHFSPKSYHDLIQVLGLSHSIHNGLLLSEQIPTNQIIAYRDDVFNYIQEKMSAKKLSNTGLANKIMDDIRRGVFAKEGLSKEMETQLLSLGVENFFMKSIKNTRYLFPKSHGILRVKHALIFMWYKLNYPHIFNFICINTNAYF